MRRFLWVFLTVLLSWVALGNFIFCSYRLRDTFSQTRKRLILIASNAALSIDAQELQAVPLEQSGDRSLAYQAISDKLVTIKKINPSLKYAYIMTTTEEPGIFQYVVDADPAPQVITAKFPRALPGDKYDARRLPEMLEAYGGPAADNKITTDEWGASISGYAPIRDDSGKPIALLGVDIDVPWIYALKKNVQLSGLLALGAYLLFIISLCGILISRPRNIV